jgi:nicotinic acid phosphoribosyltransferase
MRPVITSLLGTDLYKFTTWRLVFSDALDVETCIAPYRHFAEGKTLCDDETFLAYLRQVFDQR